MHDMTVKKGRPITYDLWFGGEPAPNATWIRKDKPLCHDPETTTIELFCKNSVYTERNSIMTILKSNRQRDTGKYTFRLESSSGVFEDSGFVNVLDVPGSPRNFEVKQVFPDKVTFSWQPPVCFWKQAWKSFSKLWPRKQILYLINFEDTVP